MGCGSPKYNYLFWQCLLTKLFGTRCSRKFLGARDSTNHSISVSLSLKFYNTAAGQCEHSGLCSVRLPTLAAEEEYWSTLIANYAQTMGNQRMILGQRKEAQRWTVIQWFDQANWTPYIQYELILAKPPCGFLSNLTQYTTLVFSNLYPSPSADRRPVSSSGGTIPILEAGETFIPAVTQKKLGN
ncbi:hypothetical protein B0H14DRAFT_3142835 [Mycena olivaceomarginata]|nr:hypothetical protein B0H14DRAFT_3142835 [Mycena olivaceomarginata]